MALARIPRRDSHDHTQRPNVHLKAMSLGLGAIQHFRSNVIGRATDRSKQGPISIIHIFFASKLRSPSSISILLNQRRQPEIANLDIHPLVKEEVAQLQVTVHDAAFVHVLTRADDLHSVILGLGFR